ncbi:hypothetical protein PbJCM13498_29060 [Prolixibacter bellariivorans]|uniref:Cupin type-2 domain-containing protein n=1 Tax=Prolixibacter bellariivorans TaxID=314319 RepID=A0A5M4B2L9_9BACT|nr:cupin domain-containing protein [Prolixibacter bellariivorans]GET34043.1 hypothetical protein PbJCM13498_29060 [Prolixibacter bellariivorans]
MTRKMENPVTGVKVEILVSTAESQGKLFKIRSTMKARQMNRAPYHYHGHFSEHFRVVEGQLNLIVGDNKEHLTLKAGESYLVKPLCPHTFWNESSEPVTYTVEVTPAKQFEKALRLNHALAAAGKASPKGTPSNIFHMAILAQLGDTWLYGIPIGLQKSAFFIAAAVAKGVGMDKKLQALLPGDGNK